jgi:hypothetical protein
MINAVVVLEKIKKNRGIILSILYVIAFLQLLMTVLGGMPIYLLPMAILSAIAQVSILFMLAYIFFVLPVQYILKKTKQPEVDSE